MAAPEPGPVVFDGELVADGRISVWPLSPVFQHGEGLFETLALISGRPLFFARHLRRLEEGAAFLGLETPCDEAQWRRDLEVLHGAFDGRDLAVRLMVFRDWDRVRRVVAATPMPEEASGPVRVGGVDPALDGHRALAGVKSLNYLVPRLAHRRGTEAGFDEVVFSDGAGRLLEGTRSSLFLVAEGAVHTAAVEDGVLPGITREVLLEIAGEAGLEVMESAVPAALLPRASEAFLSSSLRGVRAVAELLGRVMPDCPGPVTASLSERYRARVAAGAG